MDHKRVNLYREFLHDRAKGFPDCPTTRLMIRKNSNKSSKVEKYANDCFVIHKFIQGERSQEIHEVFCAQPIVINDSILSTPLSFGTRQNQTTDVSKSFHGPEMTSILLQIQSDIQELKRIRHADSQMLLSVHKELSRVAMTQDLLSNSVKGIRSRLPAEDIVPKIDEVKSDTTKLCSIVENLTSSIETDCNEMSLGLPSINCNINSSYTDTQRQVDKNVLNSKTVNQSELNGPSTSYVASPLDLPSYSHKESCPPSTRSNVKSVPHVDPHDNPPFLNEPIQPKEKTILSNVPYQSGPVSKNDKVKLYAQAVIDNSKTKENNKQAKYSVGVNKRNRKTQENDHTNTLTNSSLTDTETDNSNVDSFVAVKHKKISTFYIANIDVDVRSEDIWQYLYNRRIKATQIRVFYKHNSASARINIPSCFDETVEAEGFWPEETISRRWKNKSDWEQELTEKKEKRRTDRLYRRQQQQEERNFRQYNRSQDDAHSSFKASSYDNNQQFSHDNNRYGRQYDRYDSCERLNIGEQERAYPNKDTIWTDDNSASGRNDTEWYKRGL